MASTNILLLLFQSLLLTPQVCALSAQTEEALRLQQREKHEVKLDAGGKMQVKPHRRFESSEFKRKYPFYHTTEDLRAEAQRLAKSCNGRLNLTTVKDSEENFDLDVVTVRKEGASPINKVFLLFGEHARELISPESGIYFLRALCGDVEMKDPAMQEFLKETSTAEEVLKDSEFMMVLNSNPRSRKKVENGEYCLRINPDGVDLNRNWDERWQQEAATFGGDSNPGSKPFSEPETRIVKRLVSEYRPQTFLTIHSGTRGMYMPWAYDMNHMAKTNAKPMMDVLKAIDKDHCECPFGAAGREVGYPCPGTSLDYAYAKLNTPFAYAFEIYVDHSSDPELKQRWQDKMNSGGASLLEEGHGLGHPHFKDFFDKRRSDFVGNQTSLVQSRGGVNLVRRSSDHIAQEATADGCMSMFNPVEKDDYDKVVKNWAEAYFQMSSMIAKKLRAGEVKQETVVEPGDDDDDNMPVY